MYLSKLPGKLFKSTKFKMAVSTGNKISKFMNNVRSCHSTGSRGYFVAISLLRNHPWFYCSRHLGHQKKSGCLFQNPITFSIEGVFQNGRLYGYKNIRISELYHVAYHICQMSRSRDIGQNRSRVNKLFESFVIQSPHEECNERMNNGRI